MSRFVKHRRVFYVELQDSDASLSPALHSSVCPRTGVHVVTPHTPHGWTPHDLLADFFASVQVHRPIVWVWKAESLDGIPASLSPAVTVYECTGPAADDARLLKTADLVFTAGTSVYQSKSHLHPRVYPAPDGVDLRHFAVSRAAQNDPDDQKDLPHPRLGCVCSDNAGLDHELLRGIAERRPEWQFIVLAESKALELPNIHWLGRKSYGDLPRYFSGWDIAMMPLAVDASPDLAGDYLAAGLPVVASPLPDVVRPYGDLGLVRIASSADEFIAEAEHAMLFGMSLKWRERADRFLQSLDWDQTWMAMNQVIEKQLTGLGTYPPPPEFLPSQSRPVTH
jgi:UDP-galactopyranose mutase